MNTAGRICYFKYVPFMKFKAKILSQVIASKWSENPFPNEFLFSKNKIQFTDLMKSRIDRVDFDPFEGSPLHDKTSYTLMRTHHLDSDKPIYQIKFGKDTERYIQVDAINRLKLMWIHDRTWLQKEPLGILALTISIIALFT